MTAEEKKALSGVLFTPDDPDNFLFIGGRPAKAPYHTKTSQPSSVTATVTSHCADGLPSSV